MSDRWNVVCCQGWRIHLPHCLLMVRGREWWRKNRGCGSMRGAQQACCSQGWRAWERQPANRASSVFRRTDSEWTRLCPLHFQSQEFQGEKCLLVSLQPEITPKPAASPLKPRWWVEITQSVLTLSHGCQCSTAFLWTQTWLCWSGKCSWSSADLCVIVFYCLIISVEPN